MMTMADVKKSDADERTILERLDRELDSMIDRLAGTEADFDPAIETAALEAIEREDDSGDE